MREDIFNLFKKFEGENNYFWALRNISFDLERGGSLGIIGDNGAGKSTILKILAGVTNPSSGTIVRNGKVGALIELSAGFHPELTGRENIYLYGSIIGLSKSSIDKRFNEIVEFSGLSDFLDTPIKRYSSGMYARLGFSVTVHLNPEILLIDEVLSVGDFSFQGKCIDKMLEYKKKDVSIVFVSHNLDSVRKLCDRTILLNKGKVFLDGRTGLVIDEYYKLHAMNMRRRNSEDIIEVVATELVRENNQETFSFHSGEKVLFKIRMLVKQELHNTAFSVFVRKPDGMVVFDVSSRNLNGNKGYVIKSHETVEVCFELNLNLLKGLYYLGFNVDGSIGEGPWSHIEYLNNIYSFSIKENISVQGIAYLAPKLLVTTSRGSGDLH